MSSTGPPPPLLSDMGFAFLRLTFEAFLSRLALYSLTQHTHFHSFLFPLIKALLSAFFFYISAMLFFGVSMTVSFQFSFRPILVSCLSFLHVDEATFPFFSFDSQVWTLPKRGGSVRPSPYLFSPPILLFFILLIICPHNVN